MLETIFNKINKSPIILKQRQATTDSSEQYQEDLDDEISIGKSILHTTSENIWLYTLILMSLCSILLASINVCSANLKLDNFLIMYDWFYLCDLYWLLDVFMRVLLRYISASKTRLVIRKQSSVYIYVIDVLAATPLEIFFQNGYLVRHVMINRCLKCVHTFYIFSHLNSKYRVGVKVKILQFIYILSISMAFISIIFSGFLCFDGKSCIGDSKITVANIFGSVIDHLTTRNSGTMYIKSSGGKLLILITTCISFLGIVGLYGSEITFSVTVNSAQKSDFKTMLHAFDKFLERTRMNEEFVEYSSKFYDTMWKVCGGYQGFMAETGTNRKVLDDFEAVIPKSMMVEVHMSIFYSAFAHSILLKNADDTYLRELSRGMKVEVFTSDQFVYHRGVLKQEMVYIFSGVVDVVTEEDGDTCVIGFADGTCLGETSLVFPYKSLYKIRCVTTCILYVLSRKVFLKVSQKYPKYYKTILRRAKRRFESAKLLRKAKQFIVEHKYGDIISEEWLGYVLHHLMGLKDLKNAKLHATQNIYLYDKVDSIIYKNCLLTADHLSLLAIKSRRQCNADTLFIKSTFPQIIRPNTGLTLCWDIFIGVLALWAGVCVPYESLVLEDYKKMDYQLIIIFTGIWWLDVIVKLRTGVQLKHRLISKPLDILSLRLTQVPFIVDVFSGIPLELMSGILASKEMNNIIYINRAFKLVNAFQLLLRWEQHYNSNVILVRLVFIYLFLFYTSLIFGYAYSAVDCLKDCSRSEFNRLIFFSVQWVTGVDIEVHGYSDNVNYKKYNSVLYLLICVAVIYIQALLFSACATSQFNMLKLEFSNTTLIDIAKHLHPKLVEQVKNYIKLQNLVSKNDREQRFLNIPKPMLGFWFNRQYVDSLLELTIFRSLKRHVIVEILQTAARLRNIESGAVLFRVGDLLTHFVIVAAGSCELVSGVDSKVELVTQVRVLNDLEVHLSLPARNSVRTRTSVDIFYINYFRYKDVLYRNGFRNSTFPGLKRKIKAVALKQVEFRDSQEVFVGSFVKYGGGDDFEKSSQCWFFLPYTINPNGKFAIGYEIFRSTCGLISAFLYTTTGLTFLPITHALSIILIILDIIGVCDLYIRMHYCFYDEKGVLISHPLETGRYYVNHGIVPDVIGVFPSNLLISSYLFFPLNTNRLFQLHRYCGLVSFFRNNSLTALNYVHMITFVPVMIIILNYSVSIYVVLHCVLDEDRIINGTLKCGKATLFRELNFFDNLTVFPAHFYLLYAVSATMTKIGVAGCEFEDFGTMVFFAFISMTACCTFGILAGSLFGFFICDDIHSIEKEIYYKQLCKFIKEEKVRPKVLKHVDRHLKRLGSVTPYNVHAVSQKLPVHIFREMLCVRFKSLVQCCLVGADDFIPFIRNILLRARYEVIECNSTIVSLNDVTDQTLIIFSGVVEKIEPDGTVTVDLKPGGILGNISLSEYSRITGSFVAATTTEILRVKTLQFAKILREFPQTQQLFINLRAEHSTHIPGFSAFEKPLRVLKFSAKKKKNSLPVHVNLMIFAIGTYFSQLIYLYQLSVVNTTFIMIIANLFCDVCFIIIVSEALILPLYKQNNSKNSTIKIIFTNKEFLLAFLSVFPVYYLMNYFKMESNITVFTRLPVLMRLAFFKYYLKIKYPGNVFYCRLFIITVCIALVLFYNVAIYRRLISVGDHHMHEIDLNLSDIASFFQFFEFIFYMFAQSNQQGIYPITIYAALMTTVCMFSLSFCLCFCYARIISLLNATHQVKWHYLLSIDRLLTFMRKFEASSPVIEAVSSYSSLAWIKRQGYKYPKLLDKLPAYLKEAILFDAVGYVIDCHAVFGKCHKDFRRQLISKLKMEFYFHGDFIQNVNVADNTMYCVHYGHVLGLTINQNGYEYVETDLTTGDYFGIKQGICRNLGHTLSYKVDVGACIVYLELDSWEHLMEFFPASKSIILEEKLKS